MSRKTENKDEQTEPVDEQTEPEVKTEMTTKERIAKILADSQAEADIAVAAAEKKKEEAAAMANVDVDSDVEYMIDSIKLIDANVVAMKTSMAAEIEPLNVQIAEIKAKPKYNFEEQNKERKESYDALVEKLGEVPAKALTGGVKATGTGTGRGRGKGGGKSREQAIVAVCDEGLSFEAAAEKYDHKGNGERDGKQKVGYLVGRHIKLSVGEGTVVDNGDGTYSRA